MDDTFMNLFLEVKGAFVFPGRRMIHCTVTLSDYLLT